MSSLRSRAACNDNWHFKPPVSPQSTNGSGIFQNPHANTFAQPPHAGASLQICIFTQVSLYLKRDFDPPNAAMVFAQSIVLSTSSTRVIKERINPPQPTALFPMWP